MRGERAQDEDGDARKYCRFHPPSPYVAPYHHPHPLRLQTMAILLLLLLLFLFSFSLHQGTYRHFLHNFIFPRFLFIYLFVFMRGTFYWIIFKNGPLGHFSSRIFFDLFSSVGKIWKEG